jgi:hypothetical protein
MSTSALASARRRRATNEPQVATTTNTNVNVNKTVQQVQKDSPREQPQVQSQTLTPLQILQIHDIKIKELEAIFTEFTDEELLSKFIDEKFEALVYSKNDTPTQTSSLYTTNIQLLEQRIELQNIKIDEFKTSIQGLISIMKEENTNIMKYINSNIQNQITSNNNLLNEKITQKFDKIANVDNVINELNELKLLVISSQNLALETSNSVNKLYELFNSNSIKTKALEESVFALNSKKTDTTNIMLQSLLGGSLFKSGDLNSFAFNCNNGENCENCETDDNYEGIEEFKKINIDFNNDELLLSEEQIADLLDVKSNIDNNITIHELIVNDNDNAIVDESTIRQLDEAPLAETPLAEVPLTEAPLDETPLAETLLAETLLTETLLTETLLTEAPLTEEPLTEAPVTEAPLTEAPVTEAPVTEAPVTEESS